MTPDIDAETPSVVNGFRGYQPPLYYIKQLDTTRNLHGGPRVSTTLSMHEICQWQITKQADGVRITNALQGSSLDRTKDQLVVLKPDDGAVWTLKPSGEDNAYYIMSGGRYMCGSTSGDESFGVFLSESPAVWQIIRV